MIRFTDGILAQEIRVAWRWIARRPASSIAVVVSLGLGIGVNAAVFGAADTLLFRTPAGIQEAAGVVRVSMTSRMPTGQTITADRFSFPVFRDFLDAAGHAATVTAYATDALPLASDGVSRDVNVALVSDRYFDVLRARPALGRAPVANGAASGGEAVISDALWRRAFGAADSVLGKVVTVGGTPVRIVGVAERAFRGLDLVPVDAWLSLPAVAAYRHGPQWREDRGAKWLRIVCRVASADGVARFSGLATSALRRATSLDADADPEATVGLVSLRDAASRGGAREIQVALWLTVLSALLLALGCVNAGNTLLARSLARQSEFALRFALGAQSWQVARLLLLEGVLLGGIAGAGALLSLRWATGVLRGMLIPELAGATAPSTAAPQLLAIALALLGGFAAGAVPAFVRSRGGALRSAVDAAGGRVSAGRAARTLVTVQLAISALLLIPAGLFIQSLRAVERVRTGITLDRVFLVQYDLGSNATAVDRVALYRRAEQRARGVRGVRAVAVGATIPFRTSMATVVSAPGHDAAFRAGMEAPYLNLVTPEFFDVIGARLIRGREFLADEAQGARTVVVNGRMAQAVWGDADPIGQCLKVGGDDVPCSTVVGVVEEIGRVALTETPPMQYYLPLTDTTTLSADRAMFIRTTADTSRVAASLRSALAPFAPTWSTLHVESYASIVLPQLRSWVEGARLFGWIGALALVVALVGLYAVMQNLVVQQERDIGVQLALGASPRLVARTVVGRAMVAALAGVLCAAAVALAAGHLIAPLLFRTSPRDVATIASVTMILIVGSVVASSVPALRAARTDPVTLLRT